MMNHNLEQTYSQEGVNIAIVGASGAVGSELLKVLSLYELKIGVLAFFGSKNSAGKVIKFQTKEYKIQELCEKSFEVEAFHIAFFSAGAGVSAKYAHLAAQSGAVVIDNTSHFRMHDDVPLIVPEVNPQDISDWDKTHIIANPNCSTIQMMHVLKPLSELYDIEHVNVSTYQAVSGAGNQGLLELNEQLKVLVRDNADKHDIKCNVFDEQIALNVIPSIDVPLPSGFSKEEEKMIYESRKILHSNINISPTCVRVPVARSHSESISVKFKNVQLIDIDAIMEKFANTYYVKLVDDHKNGLYPMPLLSTHTDYTYVGRIRRDVFYENMLHLFCCADQLRIGAATNAVRIAILWLKHEHKLEIKLK